MGLLWNISFIIRIFLIFLQNAWVHISGRVYRGDFGGLQLSHHLFLLQQNDKLPKFRQQYRGGMRICFHLLPSPVTAYVFDSYVIQHYEWNEGVLSCPSAAGLSMYLWLYSVSMQNCLVQWTCWLSWIFLHEQCFKHYYSRHWCSLSCWIHWAERSLFAQTMWFQAKSSIKLYPIIVLYSYNQCAFKTVQMIK